MDAFDGFIYSQLLNSFARKRKLERSEEEEQYVDSDDFEIIAATIKATVEIVSGQKIRKCRKPRKKFDVIDHRGSFLMCPLVLFFYTNPRLASRYYL